MLDPLYLVMLAAFFSSLLWSYMQMDSRKTDSNFAFTLKQIIFTLVVVYATLHIHILCESRAIVGAAVAGAAGAAAGARAAGAATAAGAAGAGLNTIAPHVGGGSMAMRIGMPNF